MVKKNVSVKGGRGTAYGWCNIYIKTPDPCPDKQHENPCSFYCSDGICKGNGNTIRGGWGETARQIKWSEIRTKVDELVENVEFYHFYGGSGEDEKIAEVITDVRFV